MQTTSCNVPRWMNHKLESRLLGEISTTSDMQIIPLKWQKIKRNCWIIEKAKEFQKNIYFCFIDYAKVFDHVDHNKPENSEIDGNTRPPDLPLEKPICRSGSNS